MRERFTPKGLFAALRGSLLCRRDNPITSAWQAIGWWEARRIPLARPDSPNGYSQQGAANYKHQPEKALIIQQGLELSHKFNSLRMRKSSHLRYTAYTPSSSVPMPPEIQIQREIDMERLRKGLRAMTDEELLRFVKAAASRLSAARELIREAESLSENEKGILERSLDDLAVVAVSRFKRLAAKAGSALAEGLKSIVIEVVAESAKRQIWP